ncbi:hypothetical protein X975_18179, partial [Stegodyphus mimosarum]
MLRTLLQREFVFQRLTDEKDFVHALQSLKEENILIVDESKLIPSNSATEKFEFLSSLLIPFLESYYIICQQLAGRGNEVLPDCKKLSLECQAYIESAIVEGALSDYRCLSLDIVNNCITFLVSQSALSKVHDSSQVALLPSHTKLMNILLDLEIFLSSFTSRVNQSNRLSVPTAKL